MNTSGEERAPYSDSYPGQAFGRNIDDFLVNVQNLKFEKPEFLDTMRVDNAVLAAFEDEYQNDEMKRQNGAEKIHQIHLLHQS